MPAADDIFGDIYRDLEGNKALNFMFLRKVTKSEKCLLLQILGGAVWVNLSCMLNFISRYPTSVNDTTFKVDTQFMWASTLLITPALSAVRFV